MSKAKINSPGGAPQCLRNLYNISWGPAMLCAKGIITFLGCSNACAMHKLTFEKTPRDPSADVQYDNRQPIARLHKPILAELSLSLSLCISLTHGAWQKETVDGHEPYQVAHHHKNNRVDDVIFRCMCCQLLMSHRA